MAHLPNPAVLGSALALLAASAATYLALGLWPLWPRRPNYRGRVVAQGGLAVGFGVAAGLAATRGAPGPSPERGLLLFAVTVLLMAGFLDDCRGAGPAKGLKGHLRYWWQVGPDAALLKAAGGVAVGLAVAARRLLPWWEAGLEAAVVALAANTINLLDLRPGRALKGFFVLTVLLVGLTGGRMLGLLAPLAGAGLGCLWYDLRERAMLGDAGANALGAGLGVAAVLYLGPAAELGLAIALGALHAYAERGSLSGLIERIPWLARLDRLGRWAAER